MFRRGTFIIFLISAVGVYAQTVDSEQHFREKMHLSQGSLIQSHNVNDYSNEFNEFLKEQLRQMDEFRNRQNAEFAEFMKQAWAQFTTEPAIPVPEIPEPIKPIIKEPETELSPIPETLPIETIITPETPQKKPEPFVTPSEEIVEEPVGLSFDYYGATCIVPLTDDLDFNLDGVKEKSVSAAWNLLSQDKYLPLIKSCLYWRDELQLSDWGYYMFLEKMTMEFFNSGKKNEARVMQMFILTQSGYQIRIGCSGETFFLLMPFDATIYEYSYLLVDGVKFYVMDKQIKNNIFVLDYTYPNTHPLSVQIIQEPKLAMRKSLLRTLKSNRYPDVSVSISSNLNLMDFYNDCPINSEWNLYVQTSLSQNAKEQILPVLSKYFEGKTDVEIANILLDFVQTAFDYKTDQEQFGYERPLYGDETFYYPFSDCEDRSILFTIFMRELGHYDMVLLHYSDHIATAVHFNEEVRGDCFMLNNKKYVICDPTYINSSVGESMPKYRTEKAEIIQLSYK